MEKSKQIQIGLLGLVAVLLLLNLTGAFKGMFGGSSSDSVREAARANNTTNVVAPTGAATTPGAAAAMDVPVGPTTTIEFEESTFDFGTIDAGEKVSHTYKFKNTGSEPLVIKDAKGSCGCTVPKWPKEPIAPGATGDILVEYNSKGKKGKETKRVTLTANTTPAQTFLTITGEVTPDPNAPVPAKPTPTAVPAQ